MAPGSPPKSSRIRLHRPPLYPKHESPRTCGGAAPAGGAPLSPRCRGYLMVRHSPAAPSKIPMRPNRHQGVAMDMEIEGSRILRMPEVCELTGLGKSTIYKKLSEGSFPAPVRLGSRAIGWRTRDIQDWLEAPERQWNPSEADSDVPQRFRLGLPHPVCGGHVGLPQGRSCASLTADTRNTPGSCMPRRASGVSSAALDRLAALPRGVPARP